MSAGVEAGLRQRRGKSHNSHSIKDRRVTAVPHKSDQIEHLMEWDFYGSAVVFPVYKRG